MNVCALALVLLLDISSSVSEDRYQLQKQGLIESFQDPQIQKLILDQKPNGMAITAIEWSTHAEQVIDWHWIQNKDDLSQWVVQIKGLNRKHQDGLTAIGNAIEKGIQVLDQAPCLAERKLLDVSGDGSNNSGIDPSHLRDQAQTQGITINGLPILNPNEPDLEIHYRKQVVTMDGFVVPSEGFEDFARALRRKLILEIAGQ